MRENNDECPQETGPSLEDAPVVLVSACLLGAACRYDGASKAHARLRVLLAGKAVVPICPEAAAGLGTPRPPVQLTGGVGEDVWRGDARAVSVERSEDRTASFRHGAQLALDAARAHGASLAILKERSPSCGSSAVYVDGALVEGEGITTSLLRAHGVTVVSESGI